MKIAAVSVKNYKSLRNVSLDELGNLVILIGRNSSGKSNFLEILNRFLSEIDLTGVPSGIDNYSWFDGDTEQPIEITLTLNLDDQECNDIFLPEILELVKEKFPEKYSELSICRHIVKAPTGWQDKSIKWGVIPLFDEGKAVSVEQLANSLSLKFISFDDMEAVFFTPGASNTNITANRLVLLKPVKKAYTMSPYADELVRTGKVKWVNVSDKTTDWRKYASEEGYTLIEQGLSEEHLRPEVTWLRPQLISEIRSRIVTRVKGRFKLALAVRNAWPQNPLQRSPFLDSDTQTFLRNLGVSEVRTEQKRWTTIEKFFSESIPGTRLSAHPSYIRVEDADLLLPIQYRGGGEQELLFLLRFLTEEGYIFGIEEPELHTHPELARKFLNILKGFTEQGKQIFIATHSTIFVDQADLGATWIVRKEGKETAITRIEESKDLRSLLFELGIKPSDIFFANIIIFVEGETERVVLPIWAEKIGINLRSPEVSIIPTWGKNRGKYYLNVWIDASEAANIPYFMIFDKGAEQDKETKKFMAKRVLVPGQNLFTLRKGSIEDYYSQDKLIAAIESECEIKMSEEETKRILEIPRAKKIEELLDRKGKVRGEKVIIGKKVAESMGVDEIDDEIKGILERIRTKLELMR